MNECVPLGKQQGSMNMNKRVSRRQALKLVAAGGMASAASRRRGAPAFLADPAPNSQPPRSSAAPIKELEK